MCGDPAAAFLLLIVAHRNNDRYESPSTLLTPVELCHSSLMRAWNRSRKRDPETPRTGNPKSVASDRAASADQQTVDLKLEATCLPLASAEVVVGRLELGKSCASPLWTLTSSGGPPAQCFTRVFSFAAFCHVSFGFSSCGCNQPRPNEQDDPQSQDPE